MSLCLQTQGPAILLAVYLPATLTLVEQIFSHDGIIMPPYGV